MIYLTALTLATAGPLLPAYQSPSAQVLDAPAAEVAKGELGAGIRLTVPVSALVFEGEAPNWRRTAWMRSVSAPALLPRASVPGWDAVLELPGIDRNGLRFSALSDGSVALYGAAPDSDLKGTLLLPNMASDGLRQYPFTVPASAVKESDSRWREIQASRYRALAGAGIPGTAWFRRRAEAMVSSDEPQPPWVRGRSYDVGETVSMFSGGRALAENLALDEVIGVDGESEALTEDIAELEGVTTPMLDFEPLVKGLEVDLDGLSSAIPFDQHAVFFPSFASLLRVADQLAGDSAPLVQFFDGRSQNMRVRERYERQMCLELSGLARTFGSQFVESVALTGSDTYLRTGSDVAVLFQGSVPAIRGMMKAKIDTAAKDWGVELSETEMVGTPVLSAVSEGRELCVYLGAADGVVVVSNSAVQMRRVLETIAGTTEPLDSLHEYQWFRDRYPLAGEDGAEDAFAVVSDATIRRWASPHWRIATSRRTKAAAILADADAWRLGHSMGAFAQDEAQLETKVPGGGAISYESGSAVDAVYGSLSFLTPIVELEFDRVSKSEREGYESWRAGYERAWTASFDPIAVQLDVSDSTLEMDLTLVPLVVRTDYRELIDLTGTATLDADTGDFHEGAIVHWVAAIDKESSMYRSFNRSVGGFGGNKLGLNWVGDHIGVYMDRDTEYFARLEDADSLDSITEEMLPGLPIGIEIGVDNPIALAGFLTALRGMIMDAVPGMFEYETREHGGRKYVAIVPAPGAIFPETPTLFYAVQPGGLLLSFSEKLIKGSIERSVARASKPQSDDGAAAAAPWAGASTGLYVGPGFQEALAVELFQLAARDQMRARSWANLAILNEWKAAGASDPVQYHQDEWGVRLLCAGGGEYAWNEAFQTMESSVFGHPGEPQDGPNLPPGLTSLKNIGGALTFDRIGEEGARGLRAHLTLRR